MDFICSAPSKSIWQTKSHPGSIEQVNNWMNTADLTVFHLQYFWDLNTPLTFSIQDAYIVHEWYFTPLKLTKVHLGVIWNKTVWIDSECYLYTVVCTKLGFRMGPKCTIILIAENLVHGLISLSLSYTFTLILNMASLCNSGCILFECSEKNIVVLVLFIKVKWIKNGHHV